MILFLSHHLFRGYLNLFLGSTGCKTVRLKLHVWFFGSFARWNFNAGCLVNCWMLELKSTFFPFSIVPVVSRSIYLSYLILSYPIHRSCNSPPPKKKNSPGLLPPTGYHSRHALTHRFQLRWYVLFHHASGFKTWNGSKSKGYDWKQLDVECEQRPKPLWHEPWNTGWLIGILISWLILITV